MTLAPLDVKGILKKYGLSPSKGLGQNFLVDQGSLQAIVRAADITPDNTILEIGPGLGSLTRLLACYSRKVVTVEFDRKLSHVLEDTLSTFSNIEFFYADILKIDLQTLGLPSGFMVVANIPYYITSMVIRRLMESQIKPGRIVLTVQQEVAERICAQPDRMNLLGLSVQIFGKPSIITCIKAESFYPVPKVDSAVVRIDMYDKPIIRQEYLDIYFLLIKAGFSQKRKTLRNALCAGLKRSSAEVVDALIQSGIDPQRRAETLELNEWANLVQVFLVKFR